MFLWISIRIEFYNGFVRAVSLPQHGFLVGLCLQWSICQKVISITKNQSDRIFHEIHHIITPDYYRHHNENRQEAQLPQRDSASATHVFLGSLTDRALHWAPHLFYNYTVSQKKRANFETVYLEIIRIDFDDVWQKYSKYYRIEFAYFSFHIGLLFHQLFVFQNGRRK